MAHAVKCDRCGKYFDHYRDVKRTINGSFVRGIKIFTSGPYEEIDLCADCVEDMYKFVDNKDVCRRSEKEE